MWGLGNADRSSRLHALEGVVDEHGEAIKRLEHKDIEIAGALNKLSAALDTFVSDSAAGRRVLERMLGGIALHRGWLAVVAVASIVASVVSLREAYAQPIDRTGTMRGWHMFAISRKARWVMLTIFASSCGFTAIQHVAERADMVARPSFGVGFLAATSGSVAWLLATRIMQAMAMQIIALLVVRAMFRNYTNLPNAILLGVVTLLQLKTASQLIQAWGLFHDVWHVRDVVNAAEVLVEAVLIALIVTWKTKEEVSV